MKSTPPNHLADGVHRESFPDGRLRKEFTIKDGKLEGQQREWHENGQLQSEIHCLHGVLNGRMRVWSHDGLLILQQFFFDGRQVSKKKYDRLNAKCPALPAYPNEKIANTLGRTMARLRKQRLDDPDDQERIKRSVDVDCADDIKSPGKKEARVWAGARRGERCLGSLGTADTRKLVRKLYAAGALKVWVTKIEADPDGDQFGSRLIIKLPTNAGKQGKVFDILAESARPFLTGSTAVVVGLRFMAASVA